jgi:hypothetical protein
MPSDIASFAWPGTFGLITIVSLFMFRKQIAERISNIHKVGKDGVDMRPPVGQDTEFQKKYTEREFSPTKTDSSDFYIDPAVRDNFENIQRVTASMQYKSEREKIQYIERSLARLLTDNHHLFTFQTIFGSQYTFLNLLNTRHSISRYDAENFFSEEKERWPAAHEGRTFEEWVTYLLERRLITYSDTRYAITALGVDFLKCRIEWKILEPSTF